MSWLFSQALVEEFSPAIFSDGTPCAPLNVMPTQHKFWRNDKTIEPSKLSRFGLTCAVLTVDRGVALLKSFQEASRARTSASQVVASGWAENVLGSGRSFPASWARFDPITSTLKTAQSSLLGDLTRCSPTLPRSGLMLDGACYPLPPLVPPIFARESGYWPTPVASDTGDRKAKYAQGGTPLSMAAKLWPTPTASLGTKGRRVTPRKGREGGTLIEAVSARTFPTPTATAFKGWSKNHNRADTDDRIDYTIEREAALAGESGRLNPDWVEWLMGWPIGWTGLKPLETDKFREWQQQHSIS